MRPRDKPDPGLSSQGCRTKASKASSPVKQMISKSTAQNAARCFLSRGRREVTIIPPKADPVMKVVTRRPIHANTYPYTA